MAPGSRPAYLKAIGSLRGYLSLRADEEGRGSHTLRPTVEGWIVSMYLGGLSAQSRMLYLNAIAALYGAAVKAGLAPATAVFTAVKTRLKALQSAPDFSEAPTDEQFQRLQRLIRTLSTAREPQRLFLAITALALMRGAVDPMEIARMKIGQLPQLPEEQRAIAEPFATPGRRYIFPLRQSLKTPAQLARLLSTAITDLFRQHELPVYGDAAATLRAYWAVGALRIGTALDVLIALPDMADGSLPILRLIDTSFPEEAQARSQTAAATPSHEETEEPSWTAAATSSHEDVREAVARLFSAEPPGWYALRLRPAARYEALTERISSHYSPAEAPMLFYPSREIARRINRKLTYETRPVLPGIVFFRSHLAGVLPLMRLVGDLAWCYTTPDGVYARIHSSSMDLFQRCIGQFTPDYEVAPSGTFDLRPGDSVEIIGGPMAGLRGTLLQTLPASSALGAISAAPTAPGATPGTIYRISLLGTAFNIEYRLSDPRLLRPA